MSKEENVDGSLIVAERVLTLGQATFLRTDDASEPMNVDGSAGSTTVLWNGTGALDTGGDWTHSQDGTETAESMRSGTNGLDSGERTNNDNSRFSTTAFDLQASHTALQFWIQPKLKESPTSLGMRWYYDGDWLGSELLVDDYVSSWDLDEWQQVTVPLEDFGLDPGQLVDQLRFWYNGQGQKKQKHWFDDIELVDSGGGGGPYIFQVAAPDATKAYHITAIRLVLAEANTGWTSAKFTNIDALDTGLLLRQVDRSGDPVVLWSLNLKCNMHLFGKLRVVNDVVFSDSEQLFMLELRPYPASVVVTDTTVLEFVVSDDLSDLNGLRAFIKHGVEELT